MLTRKVSDIGPEGPQEEQVQRLGRRRGEAGGGAACPFVWSRGWGWGGVEGALRPPSLCPACGTRA